MPETFKVLLSVMVSMSIIGSLMVVIDKYNAKYGILISNRTDRIRFENDILYIPLVTFALMF